MTGIDRRAELLENLEALRGAMRVKLREVPDKEGGGFILVEMSGGELASMSREIRLLLVELSTLDKGASTSGVDEMPGRGNPKGSNAKKGQNTSGRKNKPRRTAKGTRRKSNGPGKK